MAGIDDDDLLRMTTQQPPPVVHPNPFGGSFQFIVQEQAKSMVAIQVRQFSF